MSMSNTLISAKSRRIRTVGIMLIGSMLFCTIYGVIFLMPRLSQLRARSHALNDSAVLFPHRDKQSEVAMARTLNRERRIVLMNAVFIYAYWCFVGLLFIGSVLMAWLDTREVARNYLQEKQKLLLSGVKDKEV